MYSKTKYRIPRKLKKEFKKFEKSYGKNFQFCLLHNNLNYLICGPGFVMGNICVGYKNMIDNSRFGFKHIYKQFYAREFK